MGVSFERGTPVSFASPAQSSHFREGGGGTEEEKKVKRFHQERQLSENAPSRSNMGPYSSALLSDTKCFESLFAEVNSPAHPSTYLSY